MVDKSVQAGETLAKATAELVKRKEKKSGTEKFKDLAMRFIGGLFMERKKDLWAISVGRCSWWLAFSPALYIWINSLGKQDISEHHLTVLLLLAAYNFGKKVTEVIAKKTQNADGPG